DVDTAGVGDHEHRQLGGPVEDQAHVALCGDVGRRDHQHLVDHQPLDGHAQDLGGAIIGLGRVAGQLHTAGLASTTSVNLRLDYHRPAQAPGDRLRLGGSGSNVAVEHRDTCCLEQVAGL